MPRTSTSGLPAALVVVLTTACALLGAAVVAAGPAAALEDPRRPTAEVTHGPSCGPGVVRVEVTNGTRAHRVALVLDGTEQDSAELAAAEQVELTSADVDWGRTVDVSITVTDPDGTVGAPLELGTYTRPSAQDCAAIAPGPSSTSSVPAGPSETTVATSPPADSPTAVPSTTGTTPATPSTVAPAPTRQSAPYRPVPGSASGPASSPAPSLPPTAPSSAGPAAAVAPGGVVTLRAAGFTPGEAVTVTLLGADGPLTTVTAGADGRVAATVQIPRDAALGSATVRLVGGLSATTAGLDLQVAARVRPLPERSTSGPVLAAGIALIGAAAGLGRTAARRSRRTATRMPG